MRKRKVPMKVISLLICLFLVLGLTGKVGVAGGDIAPAAPTEAQEEVIREAADFLEEMDMEDMADNIRTWLDNGKIKIDPDMGANGLTDRRGEITIRGSFVFPLPDDEFGRFIMRANLAELLLHEKTHAHQAPEGGALDGNIKNGDWLAGADVYRECIGPDPLEVEAYYKQIRAYLLWAEKVRNKEIQEGLSTEDAEAAQKLKEDKLTWLMSQVSLWSENLKNLNYEKANRSEDVDYLEDLFDEIDNNSELTDEQKAIQKRELLDNLIRDLFAENNFYERTRALYAEKRGEEESSATAPATPGSEEAITIELPGGGGFVVVQGLPEDLDVGLSELIEISVFDFMTPPEADPGYQIISPVYEVSWNALSPVDFTITIFLEGMGLYDMEIAAFGMQKTNVEYDWTKLETEISMEGEMTILEAQSDAATMFAVVVPYISYIDMPYHHWAYDSTARLKDSGVLDEGVVLYPGMEVTRELFIKYLVKALGLEITTEGIPFLDVDTESPYFPYISTAYHNELTSGVAADRFGMGEIIPREQSITFLIRAIGMEDEALSMPYDDMIEHIDSFFDIYTECSEWAYPYLAQAVKMLIVKGYPDGSLRGRNLLTHAEVIALIDRIMISVMYNGR